MLTEGQFEDLFRKNFAGLCNFAFSIVKDKEQGHDIAQQAFVNLWEHRDTNDEQMNYVSYLRRTVVNLSINHIHRHRRVQLEDEYTQTQLDSVAEPDRSDYLQGEVENAILSAVGKLPERSQLVFSLSRFQGMSNKEIADNLDISIKAVEKHIGKSIKELRTMLAPYLKILVFFWLSGVGYEPFKLFL